MKSPKQFSGVRLIPSAVFVLALIVTSVSSPRAVQAQGLSFPAEINKEFSPVSISSGGVSRLSITIFNPNLFQITNATWTDDLVGIQDGITIASPMNLTSTCGTDVTVVEGGTSLSLSNGTVPPQVGVVPGSCTVSINVTSTTPGNLINTIPAGGLTGSGGGGTVTNTTPASATLRVGAVLPPDIDKSFDPNTMWVGEVSQLTITIRNTDPDNALTQSSITDNLPANVILASPVDPDNLTGCGSSASLTAVSGTGEVTLNDATIAPGSVCRITVNVTSTVSGAYINTIPADSLETAQGVTNDSPVSAPLNVQGIGMEKDFSPEGFQAGGTTTLTITLQNPTSSPLTGVDVSDVLPGTTLTVVPGTASTTCNGTASATLPRTVSLIDGRVPAGTHANPGTCTISVQVTAPVDAFANTFLNTIPAGTITTDQGITNVLPAEAYVYIYAFGEGVLANKSFTPDIIEPGGTSLLTIFVTAPVDTDLTDFFITDNLPVGVFVSNPPSPSRSSECGASSVLTAVDGANSITLTGGTILSETTCQIDVYVTGDLPGDYTNIINPDDITNDEGRSISSPVFADLTIRPISNFFVEKNFTPAIVAPNGISTLTITLRNENPSDLIDVSLVDDLPGGTVNGVVVAPIPNATTNCATGIVSVTPGGKTVSMAGGTIPAQVAGVPGICTIRVDVQGIGIPSTRNNIISTENVTATLQGTNITVNPMEDASAQLTITDLSIGVVKEFDPLTVFGGSASTMSVELVNPNNAALVGIAFTDTMPTGMIVATPVNFSVGTCGGTITATPGAQSFSFSGGTLPPFGSCALTLGITMTVNGNLTNVIEAGAVTTTNGASNPQRAAASLTNLPGASVSKVFAPNPINLGEYSLLTITIQNTGNVPITGMGLIDTLPVGLQILGAPIPDNRCGGSVTAFPGTRLIQLTNGLLSASSSCTIVVSVTGGTPGSYQNIIPAGSLTSIEGATNNTPAIDTLVILGAPGTASIGDRVWNDANADGIQDITENGIDGVTVRLYASDGTLVSTTTTSGGGNYLFAGLTPGDYYVEFVPPAGYFVSPQDQGADDTVDSDANPADGRTVITTLVAGENDLTWDAGLYRPASIGSLVWNDLNADGIRDANEPGIDGVTVNLYSNDGTLIATTTTSGGGNYLFDGLAPGDYYVEFIPLAGYVFSPQDQGGNDAADSDANPATRQTSVINLTAGETDLTWYAGLYQSQTQIPVVLTKTIAGTNLPSTTGTNTAIGEIVTYRVNVTIPPGTYANATLVDTMERGLAFVACDSINAPGLATDVPDSFVAICANPTTSNAGGNTTVDVDRQVTYDFGTLTNDGDVDATITVVYRAIVLDIAANTSGKSLDNSVSWVWNDGGAGPARTTVTVVEPDLVISKTADVSFVSNGSEVTFTLTISHTQASNSDAYDVIITDVLPTGLSYVANSLNCTLGAQDPDVQCVFDDSDPAQPTIRAEWSAFTRNGGTGQIRFRVVGNSSIPANGNVTNIASVEWTSMPGDQLTPQSFTPNVFSIERHYDPNDTVDVYNSVSSLTITPLAPAPPPSGGGGGRGGGNTGNNGGSTLAGGFLIPVTGFTPNTVTELNTAARPSYGATSVTIEIPSIKVRAPIAGVQLKNGDWDVSWLVDQAGWLEGTAYPTWNGNSVITAHVVNADGKPGLFARLSKVRTGDYIFLYQSGYRYTYQIVSNKYVQSNDISVLKHEDKATITLITCDGYDEKTGTYQRRVAVRAILIDVSAEK
jgi:LPXTG-site transpeptidase (sortase) family protein